MIELVDERGNPLFLKLLTLFIVVPLIELALLIWIGQYLGVLVTIGLVILTAVVGAAMAKAQGMYVWYRIVDTLRRGRLPTDSIMDGALIFAAGVVFLTPGFLTDLTGFMLLIPPVRNRIREFLKDYLGRKISRQGSIHIELGGLGPEDDGFE